MTKKAQELKILEKMLNLPSVIIKKYYEFEGIGWIFEVECADRSSKCPRCGKTSKNLHKNHGHMVKDLPICEKETYLKINRRQFLCKNCNKPFSEELSWLKKRRGITSRLALNILEQLKKNNLKTVSEINNVSEGEIEKILEDVKEEINKKEIKNLKRLGIDEIAIEKGKHNYCAVLVDLDKKEPLRILSKRTKEVLREELLSWGEEVLKNIEEVSIDLWKGYKTVVKELMDSVVVIFNIFYVMKQINDELDSTRKKEIRKVLTIKNKKEREKKLSAIKNSKYILLKNYIDLKQEEKDKLQEVQKNFPILKKMYGFKERFRIIYNYSASWQELRLKIGNWLKQVKDLFPKSSQTIKNWIGEIISYFDNKTTQGIVEGINNKLKLIKRTAYGFRNFDNFCLRVFLNWHFQC